MALPKEVIPPAVQRCPRCRKLGLSFDPETKSVRCGACGYEVKMRE